MSLFEKEREEKLFKSYVSECLRIIAENTAKFAGGNYIELKYSDLIEPKPAERRTAEEIISGIRSKLQ